MAIVNEVYPGMLFGALIASESLLGTEETSGANFVNLDLNAVSDINWGDGLQVDDTPRTGQLISRPTDRFASNPGSTHSWNFDWAVSHQEGLDLLMQLISEDTSSPYEVIGTFVPPVYAHGAGTGEFATVIVTNPNTSRDRIMTGAMLTELTLAADNNTSGGRLRVSGTFVTGYNVTISGNSVSASGTETSFLPVLSDLTTVSFDGNDVLLDSFSVTIGYPAIPLGTQGADLEPQIYARSLPNYTLEGEIKVKKDTNSAGALTHLEAGTEVPIIFTGTDWGITVTQAVVTGYTPDLEGEKGAFVTIAFSARADGAELLYSIATT